VATVALTRVALVTAIGLLLAILAGGVFDATRASLLVTPVVVGAAVAGSAVLARRGWSRLVRLVGVAVALVAGVIVPVVLEGGGARSLVDVWRGPRQLLTTEWPSPVEPTLIATISLFVGVGVWVACELAWRERFHLAPLAPVLVVAVSLIALSAPVGPPTRLLVAFGILAIGLVLLRHGERPATRLRSATGDRTVALSTLAIVVIGVGASTAVAWSGRADPRRTEDAELTATLVDPIEAMVALRTADPALELFRVTDRSTLIGPSLPARWRIAALDVYDGQRWLPELTLRPIGGRLGVADPAGPDVRPPIEYDVELRTDDLELLPFPGRPLSVSVPVETDLGRVAVRLVSPPRAGLVVAARSEVAPTIADAQGARIATRQVDELAARFTERATNLADGETDVELLRSIEEAMRGPDWQRVDGASGGGLQLALIERFATDTRRGTREQFVTTFVLFARSLGFDARVASGFVLQPEELTSPLTISSRDAAVWPEVRVEGLGWLAFDPVPANETPDADEPRNPPRTQSPAAVQPPIPPPSAEGDVEEIVETETDAEAGRWDAIRGWVVRVGSGVGLGLVPFVVAVGTILLLKWRRRRARVRAADPAARITGAWANATDALVDAGLLIAPSWTDDRIAERAAVLAPGVPHELRRLAAMASAMRFGSTRRAAGLVDDALSTAGAVDRAIREARTPWQRVRWRLSLRSLRRSTRSPVVG
jgi:transglutaminase-like putative cysteine protease